MKYLGYIEREKERERERGGGEGRDRETKRVILQYSLIPLILNTAN